MRERAEVLRLGFTELLVAVDPDPVVPDPGGSALTEAVAVIAAAAAATVRRWGAAVGRGGERVVGVGTGRRGHLGRPVDPDRPGGVDQHELSLVR
jgi:hypothetical protein